MHVNVLFLTIFFDDLKQLKAHVMLFSPSHTHTQADSELKRYSTWPDTESQTLRVSWDCFSLISVHTIFTKRYDQRLHWQAQGHIHVKAKLQRDLRLDVENYTELLFTRNLRFKRQKVQLKSLLTSCYKLGINKPTFKYVKFMLRSSQSKFDISDSECVS